MVRRNKHWIDLLLFNLGLGHLARVWSALDHTDECTQGIAGCEEQYCNRKSGTAIDHRHPLAPSSLIVRQPTLQAADTAPRFDPSCGNWAWQCVLPRHTQHTMRHSPPTSSEQDWSLTDARSSVA